MIRDIAPALTQAVLSHEVGAPVFAFEPFVPPPTSDDNWEASVCGDWPEIDTPCDESPTGQCEYDATAVDWRMCKHCRQRTG